MSKRKRIIAFISVFVVLLSTLLPFTAAAWDIVVSDKYSDPDDDSVSVYTPPNAFISFSYPFLNTSVPGIQTEYPTMNFLNYLTTETYLSYMGRESFSAYLPPSNPFGETQFYMEVDGVPVDDINGYLNLESYGFTISNDLVELERQDKFVQKLRYDSDISYIYFPEARDQTGALDLNRLECYLRVENSYAVDYDRYGSLLEFEFNFTPRTTSREFWYNIGHHVLGHPMWVNMEYSFLGSDVIHTYSSDALFLNDYVDYFDSDNRVTFLFELSISDFFPSYTQPQGFGTAFVDASGDEFPGIYIHSFDLNIPLSAFCDSTYINIEVESFYDMSVIDYRTIDLAAKMANFNPEDLPLTVSWLGTAVGGFFDLQIVPGFSLGGIFLIIIAFSVVMWFLKVFGGG